ncbi:MAG: alpha/beta fold hydrolase [Lysobacterales bacterium]
MSHSLKQDISTDVLTSLPPLTLDSGEVIAPLQLSFEAIGPSSAPAVFVMGGISASRHAGSNEIDTSPGWWEAMVGCGKALDTRRLRVISMDFVGGNGQSSGPRNSEGWPRTLTPGDQASAITMLLDALNIQQLASFVGASYGGMVALEFGRRFPERASHLAILGAAHRPPAMATALRCVQREAVRTCARLGNTAEGLRLSRAIGMSTYRSDREFDQRFSREPKAGEPASFEVEDYLFARGHQFAQEFHPDAYLTLSTSIDCLDTRPEDIHTPVSLLAFEDDFVAPPSLMRDLHARLSGDSTLKEISTLFGHDAFLKEVEAVSQWLTEGPLNHQYANLENTANEN